MKTKYMLGQLTTCQGQAFAAKKTHTQTTHVLYKNVLTWRSMKPCCSLWYRAISSLWLCQKLQRWSRRKRYGAPWWEVLTIYLYTLEINSNSAFSCFSKFSSLFRPRVPPIAFFHSTINAAFEFNPHFFHTPSLHYLTLLFFLSLPL